MGTLETRTEFGMTDDPLELRLAARRNRAARNRLLLLVAMVLATGAVAAVGVTLALNRHLDDTTAPTTKAGGAQPSERSPVVPPAGSTGKPRGEWNHADLAAHLKSKGVAVRIEGAGFPLSSFFVDDAAGQKIYVDLTASERAASDEAAAHGGSAFSWHRFAIFRHTRDDDALLARVRAALN